MDSLALFNQFTSRAEVLTEAWGDPVAYEPQWDTGTGYGLTRLARQATTLYDRADGRFLPVYQTEFDLACIRAMGRTLFEISSELVGGVRNLCNYTIGEGFKFTATREETCGVSEEMAAPLIGLVQREINYLLDDNDFTSNFDHEIYKQSIIDGETLLHLKFKHDGRVRIYRREPDELRMPAATRDLYPWIESAYGIGCLTEFEPSFSFAVLTRLDQPDEPLGYHFVSDERGVSWLFEDASRVVHIKRNVPRNAKRGFSDLYPVEGDATRGYKLMRNMTEGATARAAIVFIREFVAGTTRTTADAVVGGIKTGTGQQSTQSGNRSVPVERYDSPRIVNAGAGMQYKPSPSSDETADFLLLAKEVKRQQAVRWSMPEYMFSGDASNSAYASTLEATSPFVKSCEGEQRVYSKHYINLIWKALKMRHEAGAFGDVPWEDVERIVKVSAECPTVATRDPLKVREALKMEMDMGITSPDTAATECGRDLKVEQDKGARPAVEGGGFGGPRDPNNPEPNAGAFAGAKRSDFTNNAKATNDILQGYIDKKYSEVLAKVHLQRLGWSDEQSQSMLDDAKDGAVDNPLPEDTEESIIPEPVSNTISRWETYP